MRQLLTTTLLCIFSSFYTFLHAQTYSWVKGGATNQDLTADYFDEEVLFMCTDCNGNIYSLSNVGTNAPMIADTFYRATGAFGNPQNILLTSYNCSGQMRWAKLIASQSQIYPNGIVLDNSGHVYVAGYFNHSAGSHILRIGYDTAISTVPYQASGVIRFDTNGQFNWIRFVGDNSIATLSGIGTWEAPLLFDGTDIHYICNTGVGVPLTPTITSHYGAYDLRYSITGNLLDVKRLQMPDTTLFCYGATIDTPTDKLFIYGSRSYTFSSATQHPFLAAFDTARNMIWEDTLRNPFATIGAGVAFSGITTDNSGYLYTVGGSYKRAIFRGDSVQNVFPTSSLLPVAFVLKTDTSGNVKWMKGYSGSISVNALVSISLMPNGTIASSGVMAGMIVSGADTIISYGGEGQNAYFTIIDTGGYIHTLQQIHGAGFYDKANCTVSDSVGNLYIGGKCENNTWGGTITPYTSVGGNTDFYVMKYGVNCGCTSMPTASYTDTGTIVHGFTYTGTTTGIDSVRWTFGDGTTSTLFNPVHTYLVGGTFSACIRVYSSCGSDFYCKTITIPCVSAPTASFAVSGTGLTRTFTYTGTTTGVSSISWTFSDGGVASGSIVPHTFSAAATYTACVTAVNPCGSTTICTPVTITCTATPVSAYTFSGTGLTRSFTYTGTTTGLDSVTWTFGDGSIATGLTPSHTYAAAGTYTVCAKVYTNCGVHTFCSPIVVACLTSPIASFTYSGTGGIISFTYTGTTAGMDSVRWDFGDGGTSALLAPSHTYAIEDTFNVCVRVYTNCGSDMSCQNVIITCITPVTSSFIDTGNLVHGFAYTGTIAGYDSVVWNFGDGNSDTGLAVIHTYLAAGTYIVCAKVYTDCDNNTYCRSIVISAVAVRQVLLASIEVFPNPSKEELYVTGVQQEMDYRVINVVGVVLQKGILHTGNNTISIRGIVPGILILEMTAKDGSKNVIRVVKE